MRNNALHLTSRHRLRSYAGFLAVASLVLAAWQIGPQLQSGGQPLPAAVVTPVVVEPVVVAEHVLPPLELSGRVEAVRRGSVGFQVAGVVVEVLVEAGDVVPQEQVLARLDRTRLQAARAALEAQRLAATARQQELVAGPRPQVIERARAAVNAAQVRLELAQSTARRHCEALAAEAVSAQAEEAARRDVDVAAATLAQAEAELAELLAGTRAEQLAAQAALVAQLVAQLQQLDRDLADCELRAPYAARVEARTVERGMVVAPGSSAFELVSAEALRVRVGLPADLAASELQTLRDGVALAGAVTVRGRPVEVLAAELTLLPQVRAQVRTVDALLPIAAAAADLRAGDLALVGVSAGRRTGIAVPVSALRAGPRGLFRCFVAEPVDGIEGRFRAANRDVQVAEWLGERVLVTGGLAAGERLIVSGADHVLRGMPVAPTESR